MRSTDGAELQFVPMKFKMIKYFSIFSFDPLSLSFSIRYQFVCFLINTES